MTIVAGVRRHAAAFLMASLVFAGVPSFAHEGEEHGSAPAAEVPAAVPALSDAPAGEAHSALYEVVVQGGEDPRLTIYLDDYATNAPVEGASLSVIAGGRRIAARPVSAGTFEARLPQALPHGNTNLRIAVQAAAGDEILMVPVVVPDHAEEATGAGLDWRSMLIGAGALLVVAAIAVGAWFGLRRRPALTAGALAMVGLVAFTPDLKAHGDEVHADEPEAGEAPAAVGGGVSSGASDRPVRAADGSVLLPKPSQRLLGVRTIIGESGTGAAASRLQAQVIPDPARFARVATARGGRVLATSAGFPRPGQSVAAGQALFQLQPALSAADAAGSAAEVRSLEREVRLAEQELRRLEQLRGIVARAEIERARTNLSGLRAQRGAAAGPVQSVEVVRAPIGGTVSTVSTAIGAVAEPGAPLAEIVGNGGWLIEARGLAPGQRLAGRSAVGVTTDGRRIGLRFIGRSPQLVEGADRFLFAVTDGAGTLRGGEAITVEAVLVGSTVQRGIAVPADAITRAGNGEAIAWVKPSALRFEPRQVRTQPLPGGRVLVTAGLRPGERVVTQAASLLGQIR